MTGFFKNRPAVGRKNVPGRRTWFKGENGETFALAMGGRRAPLPKQYSMDHLVVETGWVRFNHRLERKRRAL